MANTVFTPDRDRIFMDLDYCDVCEQHGCTQIHLVGKYNHPMCNGEAHACPRTKVIADEINQFIGDNDDMFMYIQILVERRNG